jgi:hypothetical protein
MKKEQVEPWLRGTLMEADPLARGVLHALELAAEDVAKWCGGLSEEEMEARPYGVAPVGFHMRHIARSLDRLLSYAEGQALTQAQMAKLKTEMDGGGDSTSREATMLEFAEGLGLAVERVRRFDPAHYGQARSVGRKKLPTTLGGLLVHCAEHTSRHVGQAVTTAKVVAALR